MSHVQCSDGFFIKRLIATTTTITKTTTTTTTKKGKKERTKERKRRKVLLILVQTVFLEHLILNLLLHTAWCKNELRGLELAQ